MTLNSVLGPVDANQKTAEGGGVATAEALGISGEEEAPEPAGSRN